MAFVVYTIRMVKLARLARIPRILLFVTVLLVGASTGFAQDRKLVYGLVPNAPPTTYVDASGKPTGFFIELYSRIMDELGIDYEFRVGPFQELFPALVSGEVDFFTTLQKTPEREKLLVFPASGVTAGWSQLFVALGTELQSVLDLQLKRIGVVSDDRNGQSFRTYIASLAIPCEIVEYRDFEALVQAVLSGEVFGGVQSNWFVAAEERVQPTTIVFAPFQAYPVLSMKSPFNSEFEAILDRYSSLLADHTSYYYELQAAWLGHERTETTVVPAWLVAALATLLAAAAASAVTIRMLTRRLRVANRDLERTVKERTDLLVRSERFTSLGTLVSNIAHELNTPLQVMRSGVEVLREPDCPEVVSSVDAGRIDALLSRRDWNRKALFADSRSARRASMERLAALGVTGDEAGRLSETFAGLGIVDPDMDCVSLLRGADESFIEAALDRSKRLDALDSAGEAAERMSSVIGALRIYAHRDHRGEVSVVSLKQQLDSVLTLLSSRSEPGIQIVRNIDGLPDYRCFADQLQQVWMNLFGNAIEAMHGSGTLTVSGQFDERGVTIAVSDTGPGIPPGNRDRIFEPFFTTKPEGTGTGLGLSIALQIVRNHRGSIDFTTGSGGTTFVVTLPVAGAVDAVAQDEEFIDV